MNMDGGLQLTDTERIRKAARDLGYPIVYTIFLDGVSERGAAHDRRGLSSRIQLLWNRYGKGEIKLEGRET